MKVASLEAIARALEQAGVRYLIAGGLAVNAHAYLRLTYDVDLVIQLDRPNVLAAFEALASRGNRPRCPSPVRQHSDAHCNEAGCQPTSRPR